MKKKSFTISMDIELNDEVQKFINEELIRIRHEETYREILDSFKAMSDAEFEHNKDFYNQPHYNDNFKEWLRESTEKLKMWALQTGWEMCYQYHKERIEREFEEYNEDWSN